MATKEELDDLNKLRAEIRAAALEVEPEIDQDSEDFQATLTLLASTRVGPNIKKIVTVTGVPTRMVSAFAANLRKNGVWKNGKIYANWADEKDGGIEFILDCLVARGLMDRAA